MSDRSRERSRSRSRSRSRRRSEPPANVDDDVPIEEFKSFVGGIPWQLDDRQLKEVFAEFNATKAKVQVDKYSGRSRGFGFVWFPDAASCESAIEKLHDHEIEGRRISVTKAVPQSRTAPGTPADALRRGDTLPRDQGRFRRGPPPARYAPYDRRGGYDRYDRYDSDRGYDRDRERGRFDDRDRGYGGYSYSGGYAGGDRYSYDTRYDGNRGYDPESRYGGSETRGRGYDDRDRAPLGYGAPPTSMYGDRGSGYGDRPSSYGTGPPPSTYGAVPPSGGYEPYVPAPYGGGGGAPPLRDAPPNGGYYEPSRYGRDAPYDRPPR